MTIKGLLTDRKNLVAALQEVTGLPAKYCGAPSFQYKIGDYTILRDGSLEIEDGKANQDALKELASRGLIEFEAPDEDCTEFTFPAESLSGQTVVNLIYTIAAREKLLNKAVGKTNAFHISPALLRQTKEDNPDSIKELMETIFRAGGEHAMRGLKITPQAISFTGFPKNSGEEDAHAALAEKMLESAGSRRWIRPDQAETENEKYSFRVWLNSIGMKGKDYADARATLLKRLSGNTAFRTEEQKTQFYEARRKKPAVPAPEPDFIVL